MKKLEQDFEQYPLQI